MLKAIHARLGVATGIWLLYAASAMADEAPFSGMVYNTKKVDSLVYFCKKNHDNSLDCEFIQTRVRKKAKAQDLKSRLDEARKAFSTSKELTPEMCKEQKNSVEVLHGRKEQQDFLKNISDLEKKDILQIMSAMTTACDSKTEENYLNVVRIGHDKDTRTCIVISHTYKQSFRLVLDRISGARSWVAKGEPSSPCGVVQLSRFEPESLKDSKLVYWKYVAKEALTNPQGLLMPGLSCKDLDEDEHVYDWRSKEHALGCDYIEFSTF